MKSRLLMLSTASVIAFIMLAGAAAQAPAARNAAFDRLESQWLDALDVTPSLSPGREDLALLMRKDATVGRSWQLEPSLIATMTDDEIFRFVVSRANSVLACGLAQLWRKDLSNPSNTRASARALVAPQLWKGPPAQGPLRVSPACNVILDQDRQPATLARREDLDIANSLMSRFVRPTSQQQLLEMAVEPQLRDEAASRLRANLKYLRSQYGGPPDQEPDLAAILGRPNIQVFSRQVMMFQAFMASTGSPAGRRDAAPPPATDRLILVVPLSQ